MKRKEVILASIIAVLCLAVVIEVIVFKNNYKKSDLESLKTDEEILDNEALDSENIQSEDVFVVISINPKLMLKINDNKIIEVYQLNDDSIIFTNDELKGLDVEKGIEKIIDISKENNYITNDTEVKLSLYENTNDKDNVIDTIKSKFSENNIKTTSYTINKQESEEIKNIVTNYKEQVKVEIKKYIVTFNSNGGSVVDSQTIEENNKVTKPTNPTRNGYEFSHWAYDNKEFDFNTNITSDITLLAVWNKKEEQKPTQPIEKKKYTVTFNSNGGSAISSQTIEENSKVTKPSNPTRNGFTFLGWYYNNNQFDFNTKITSNLTLNAKWEAIIISATAISLDQDVYYMFEKDTIKINSIIIPSNTTDKTVIWSSSDTSIATVDNGNVSTLKSGEVTITATINGKSSSCTLKILPRSNDSSKVNVYVFNYDKNTNKIINSSNNHEVIGMPKNLTVADINFIGESGENSWCTTYYTLSSQSKNRNAKKLFGINEYINTDMILLTSDDSPCPYWN